MSSTKGGPINDWDELWRRVKPFGRWQCTVTACIGFASLLATFPTSMEAFTKPAVTYHYCDTAEQLPNFSVEERFKISIPPGSQCSYYDIDYSSIASLPFSEALEKSRADVEAASNSTKPCVQWHFNGSVDDNPPSMEEEFLLVCNRAMVYKTISILFAFLSLVLGVSLACIADRVGRRPIIVVASVGACLSGFLIALASPNYPLLVLFQSLESCSFITLVSIGFSLVIESVGGARDRAVAAACIWIVSALGLILLPLLANVFPAWRHLVLARAAASVPLLFFFWLIPESPRWLLATSRLDDAQSVLQNAAERNNAVQTQIDASALVQSAAAINRGCCSALCASPRLTLRTLILILLWVTNSALYYGFPYDRVYFASVTSQFLFQGVSEIVASVLVMALYARFDRRWPLAVLYTAIGACCFAVAAMSAAPHDEFQLHVVIVATVGYVLTIVGPAMTLLYSAELFPTVERCTAMACLPIFGRLGAAGAPFLQLIKFAHPQFVLGVCAFVAALIATALPEIRKSALLQSTDDAKQLGRRRKETPMNSTDAREFEKVH